MARPQVPGKTARNTTWLVLAACLSSAAHASTSSNIDCDDASDLIRINVVEEISADPASHDNDLTPRVEALIREAFDDAGVDSDLETAHTEDAAETDAEESEVQAALPGVSDDDARIYRREMYRTDI